MDQERRAYLRQCEMRERAAAKLARTEEQRRECRERAEAYGAALARLDWKPAAPAPRPIARNPHS